MAKKLVGVIGASGYTGLELLRLLAQHPEFSVKVVTANSEAGKSVGELYPHLHYLSDLPLLKTEDALKQLNDCDLVFSGLPHGEGMAVLSEIIAKVVDLSSDFRLLDPELYPIWYGCAHTNPEELKNWLYGLPECFRSELTGATTRIANPGCYATAAILALAPAVAHGLLEGPMVIDACSGTTGAGKKLSNSVHFSHLSEGMNAYKVGAHQHTAEIEQALTKIAAQAKVGCGNVSMTAHLLPIARGIHATCSSQMKANGGKIPTSAEVIEIYKEWFKGEPFVTIAGTPPHTKLVRGTNRVIITPFVDHRTTRLIVVSVLDNLVKGAAGQAIQNANIITGCPETLGLMAPALYP